MSENALKKPKDLKQEMDSYMEDVTVEFIDDEEALDTKSKRLPRIYKRKKALPTKSDYVKPMIPPRSKLALIPDHNPVPMDKSIGDVEKEWALLLAIHREAQCSKGDCNRVFHTIRDIKAHYAVCDGAPDMTGANLCRMCNISYPSAESKHVHMTSLHSDQIDGQNNQIDGQNNKDDSLREETSTDGTKVARSGREIKKPSRFSDYTEITDSSTTEKRSRSKPAANDPVRGTIPKRRGRPPKRPINDGGTFDFGDSNSSESFAEACEKDPGNPKPFRRATVLKSGEVVVGVAPQHSRWFEGGAVEEEEHSGLEDETERPFEFESPLASITVQKRGRGRPRGRPYLRRTAPIAAPIPPVRSDLCRDDSVGDVVPPKRKRGRPRKILLPVVESTISKEDDDYLHGTASAMVVAELGPSNLDKSHSYDVAENLSRISPDLGESNSNSAVSEENSRRSERARVNPFDSSDWVIPKTVSRSETTSPAVSSVKRGKRGRPPNGSRGRGARSSLGTPDWLCNSQDNTKCGVCLLECESFSHLKRHMFMDHNGLAKPYGDPTPLTKHEERYLLSQCIKKLGKLRCLNENCTRTFASVYGYTYHAEICGKGSEREMISCEICGRMLIPASLKSHMKLVHAPEPVPTTSRIGEVEDGPIKRNAAKKALTKVAELASEVKSEPSQEESDSEYVMDESEEMDSSDVVQDGVSTEKLFISPKRHHNSSAMFSKWKEELQNTGCISCLNEGCTEKSHSMKKAQNHSRSCMHNKQGGALYTCIICQYSCILKRAMLRHVQKHTQSVKEKTNSNVEMEAIYRVSLPTTSRTKGNTFFRNPTQIFQSIRCGEFDSLLFAPHIDFATRFFRDNYDSSLFTNWKNKLLEWKLLEEKEAASFLPTTKESIQLKVTCCSEDNHMEAFDSEWMKLNSLSGSVHWSIQDRLDSRFICFHGDDDPKGENHVVSCFTGGPIWSCAWCPTPHGLSCKQYIALSNHQKMDLTYTMETVHVGPGLIQIWEAGELERQSDDLKPCLRLALAHNFGAVWSLTWCPSGCWEDPESPQRDQESLPRLGLLAAAFSDGYIRIYSIPHPSILNLPDDGLPIYEVDPVVTLLVGPTEVRRTSQPTSLSWFQGKGHNFIAAGFTNGVICIWDLATTSILLKLESEDGRTRLVPFLTFQAHSTIVTGVDFSHKHKGRFLASSSRDRYVKIWDLKDLALPYNAIRSRAMNGVKWPIHWCGVYSYGDHCYNMQNNCTTYYECGYFREMSMNLAQHNADIWDASPSFWLNSLVSCDSGGEVIVSVIGHLMQNTNLTKVSNHRRLPLYRIETGKLAEDLKVPQESNLELDSPIEIKCEKYEQKTDEVVYRTYDEVKKNLGLKYYDAAVHDLKQIPLKELQHICASNTMNSSKVNQFPIVSINRVAWNPNLGSHLWIACAEQSGILRLINIKGLVGVVPLEKVRGMLNAPKTTGPANC